MDNLQKLKTERRKYKKILKNIVLFLMGFSILSLFISIFIWITFVFIAAMIIIVTAIILSLLEKKSERVEQTIKDYFFNLPKNKKIKEDYEKILEEYEKFLKN